MTEQEARILQIYRQFCALDEDGRTFILQSLDGSGKPHVQLLHDILERNK